MKLPRHIATGLGAHKRRASQLVIVIGKPGAGKTRYALSIAANLTLAKRPVPILLLCPGTRAESIMEKIILLGAGLDPSALRDTFSGRTLKTNWPKIVDSAERISGAPLYINTRAGLWPMDIWLCAGQLDSHLRRQGKRLGLIIADDLHRIGGRSYEQKVSDFKILAREMRLLIIVLARPHPSLAAALRRQRVASTTLPASEKP